MGRKLTEEQEQNVIVDYQQRILTNNEIAQKYNISKSTIIQILKRNNIVPEGAIKRNRVYYFNEHYLDVINTEEKAYFLGFIYADGSHSEKKHSLIINLKKEDEILLKKFYTMFDCDKNIYYIHNKKYNKDYAQFSLISSYLSAQLLKLGVVSNKTFKLTFPSYIPNHLIRHFIRGYFDGDGSIILPKRGWKSTTVHIVGNKQFIHSVREIIKNETGKLMGIYSNKNSNVYEVKSSGIFNVYSILNYLYKDATIYLQRKYDRYIDFITKYKMECLNNE
jgi:intein/homing endonuclease